MIVRNLWKRGPDAGREQERVFVSATIFRYGRYRDFLRVAAHGGRLRMGWRRRQGAVGLFTGFDPRRRTTYTLSVWTSEEALRGFLRSPEHVRLVRGFRERLVGSGSLGWETDSFRRDPDWRRAVAELSRRSPGSPSA